MHVIYERTQLDDQSFSPDRSNRCGISLLGAGTILKYNRKKSVEGLTTSASILSVAAIGIAVALDAYLLAIGVTLLDLFINWGVSYLVRKFGARTK